MPRPGHALDGAPRRYAYLDAVPGSRGGEHLERQADGGGEVGARRVGAGVEHRQHGEHVEALGGDVWQLGQIGRIGHLGQLGHCQEYSSSMSGP